MPPEVAQLKVVAHMFATGAAIPVEGDDPSDPDNLQKHASLVIPPGLRHLMGLDPTLVVDDSGIAACFRGARTEIKKKLSAYWDLRNNTSGGNEPQTIQSHVWKNERWQPANQLAGEFGFGFPVYEYNEAMGDYGAFTKTLTVLAGTPQTMAVVFYLAVQKT